MRRTTQILLLAFLYFLFTAKSCDQQEQSRNEKEAAKIESLQDSIRTFFASDSLSESSLRVFEQMAKQKFSDFADYLKLLSDTTIAQPFREKTRTLIPGLFISENSLLQFSVPVERMRKKITISQLLAPGCVYTRSFGSIPQDSIKVIKSLKKVNDSVYSGTLQFTFDLSGQSEKESSLNKMTIGSVDFLVTKLEKRFGKQKINIWDVYLGMVE